MEDNTNAESHQNESAWWVHAFCWWILLIPILRCTRTRNYDERMFGSMRLIHEILFHPLCITLFILLSVILVIYNSRIKAPVIANVLTICKLALLFIILFFAFNPHALDKLPQIPYSLLFLYSAICISYGALKKWAIVLWVPIWFISLIYRLTEYAHIEITRRTLSDVFGATWEEAAPYITCVNCLILLLCIVLSINIAILIHLVLKKERRSSLISTGFFFGSLLILGLLPIKNLMRMDESDIWPLGSTAWITWESTQAIFDMQRMEHISNMPPGKDTHAGYATIPDNGSVSGNRHVEINAYHRDTTPWLKKINNLIINFY